MPRTSAAGLVVHLSHSLCVEAGIYFWFVSQFSRMAMLLSNFDDLDLSTIVALRSKFVCVWGGLCIVSTIGLHVHTTQIMNHTNFNFALSGPVFWFVTKYKMAFPSATAARPV